ncbi:MAG: endonuclease III [Defluviitaleaceae bacterium]|nr:endonuclease III [Defluviitaleaceae bacterium]
MENVKSILKILDELYPFDGKCFLNHELPWQLLFATILSAQCTDACVNRVTAGLFKKFPELEAFASAEIKELEDAVRQTGFFRTKARHLQQSARQLLSEFGGEVPSGINELTSLGGVGRKTANVVRCHIFNIPSIVVDTHVMRISGRLGLTRNKSPEKIEQDLMKILPKTHWLRFNQQVITHGRQICIARKPHCEICKLRVFCTQSASHFV